MSTYLSDFKNKLEASGLPVTYLSWPEDECPEMPFITFQETGTDNFAADGVVHQVIHNMQVDLFSHGKDLNAEDALENALSGVFWNKFQTSEDD